METKGISQIILGILLLIAVFLVVQKVDVYLKNKAVDDCGKVSRSEFASDGNKTIIPVNEVYERCLKDKGVGK